MNKAATSPRRRAVAAAEGMDPVGGGAALKLAIVGPSRPDQGSVAAHTTVLAHRLAQAGHDVTLVSWARPFPGMSSLAGSALPARAPGIAAFPRTIRTLSWARPDTWLRVGRRLRGFDAVIIVHVMPIMVPAHLCVLRAAGAGGVSGDPADEGAPRSIVIAHNVLPRRAHPGDRALVRSLFERVDAVLVHSQGQGRLAQDLQAARVSVVGAVELSPALDALQEEVNSPDLSSPWAHYVGAMEALATPRWHAPCQDPADTPVTALPPPSSWTRTRTRTRTLLGAAARAMAPRRRPALSMTRRALPEWVRASDVLGDRCDADDARDWARAYGLPRCAAPIAAWAALGALAAIVRLGDDGQRSAVIIDGSGGGSPLSSWARAIGFEPLEQDFSGSGESQAAFDADTASVDVITRLHPKGCDSQDVDEALSQASWALRIGGLISLTLPLGPVSADGAVGPADVRAHLARAHDLGLVLVGDLDGEITTLMRAASEGARRGDAAYALVRLTFRRR